jgi:hypothetical protein
MELDESTLRSPAVLKEFIRIVAHMHTMMFRNLVELDVTDICQCAVNLRPDLDIDAFANAVMRHLYTPTPDARDRSPERTTQTKQARNTMRMSAQLGERPEK